MATDCFHQTALLLQLLPPRSEDHPFPLSFATSLQLSDLSLIRSSQSEHCWTTYKVLGVLLQVLEFNTTALKPVDLFLETRKIMAILIKSEKYKD